MNPARGEEFLRFPYEVLDYWRKAQLLYEDRRAARERDSRRVAIPAWLERFWIRFFGIPNGAVTAGGGSNFMPRFHDKPQRRDGIVIQKLPGRRVKATWTSGEVLIKRLDPEFVKNAFALFDGEKTFKEVFCRLWEFESFIDTPPSRRLWRAFFSQTMGSAILAPHAVAELETLLLGVEISRWPRSPYEVDVAYWQNMGAVRKGLVDLLHEAANGERFAQFLSRLHAVSLMGDSARSFPLFLDVDTNYVPGSALMIDLMPAPGKFYDCAQLMFPIFDTSKPMFKVFEVFHSTLGLGPLPAEPSVFLEDGVPWGHISIFDAVKSRSRVWWRSFPRPVTAAHFDTLASHVRDAFDAGLRGDENALLTALSRLHRRFGALHLFRAGNQSLVMNIVNHLLKTYTGWILPHGNLDWISYAVSDDAYREVFIRYVRAFRTRPDTKTAYQECRDRFQRLDRMVADAGKVLHSKEKLKSFLLGHEDGNLLLLS